MYLGLGLLYVGAVLVLNGIWLLGGIQDKEIWVINFFTGGLVVLVALYSAFGADPDRTTVLAAAQFLLFAFTYIWVGINRFIDADGRGLGWFCLFVAITAVPIAISLFATGGPIWLAFDWTVWAVLWFVYWLLLAVGMTQLTRFSGWFTIAVGVVTAWIPGYLLLTGTLSV
ncbi:MAG: AmiS/UreI family transporter [Rubrobacteraceae bacterium]